MANRQCDNGCRSPRHSFLTCLLRAAGNQIAYGFMWPARFGQRWHRV